jgi:hypothetical protein
MFAHRTLVAIGLLCVLGMLAVAQERDVPDDDKAKTAEVKKPDISKLPNDDLLKQAAAIFARGSGDYHAAVRAAAGVEAQLNDAAKQLADLTQPRKWGNETGPQPRGASGPVGRRGSL